MSQLPAGVSVSRAEDRKRLLWAGKTTFDLILDSSQTEGSIALMDQWGERGDTTPMHIHRGEAEIFYVLEGDVIAWAGHDQLAVGQGGALYLPADLQHAFGVVSSTAPDCAANGTWNVTAAPTHWELITFTGIAD